MTVKRLNQMFAGGIPTQDCETCGKQSPAAQRPDKKVLAANLAKLNGERDTSPISAEIEEPQSSPAKKSGGRKAKERPDEHESEENEHEPW